MDRAKYIIKKIGTAEYPVIFHPGIMHSEMATSKEVVAAGFLQIYEDKVSCFGKSVSLKVESRGQVDADLIQRTLFPEF